MALDPKNQYAFDECSILHFCQLRVPAAWRAVFGDVLQHRNYPKLLRLLHGLQKCFIPPYRFAPASNLEGNLIRTAEGLLEGRAAWMPNPVKKLILEQLQEYLESLDGYSVIEKGTEFSSVKAAFTAHQRPLAKSKLGRYSNIPEDDDCGELCSFFYDKG